MRDDPYLDIADEAAVMTRVRSAIASAGGTKAVNQVSGIPVGTLNKYVAGTSMPSFTNAAKIARAAKVTMDWLVGAADTKPLFPDEAVVDGMVPVPLLDVRPSAGAGTLVEQLGAGAGPEIVAFREDWLRRIGVSPRFARLMVCQGDSMHDTISDGDLMIVDVGVREVANAGIYVLLYAGLVIVKRVQVLRDRSILLKSDNPRYEPETVPFHDLPELSVEGRVRWAGGQI